MQVVVVHSQVGSGMLLGVMLMLLLIMSPLTDGNVRSTTSTAHDLDEQ